MVEAPTSEPVPHISDGSDDSDALALDHKMITGLADMGRIGRQQPDSTDGEPVQNVNIRTKPQHTDAKPRA
jgi:hypothetical protein